MSIHANQPVSKKEERMKILTRLLRNLSRNISAARHAKAGGPISQQGLAEGAGLSRAALMKIEASQEAIENEAAKEKELAGPRLGTIVRIAQELGVPPFLLLLGPEEIERIMGLIPQLDAGKNDLVNGLLPKYEGNEQMYINCAAKESAVRNKAIPEMVKKSTEVTETVIDRSVLAAAAIGSAISPGVGTLLAAALASASTSAAIAAYLSGKSGEQIDDE